MAREHPRRPIRRGPATRSRKLARTFRLTPGKVEAAQRILGASTATEAIETALDMVLFRQALVEGTEAMFGVKITPPSRR